MSWPDWIMAIACLLFMLAGVATLYESRNLRIGIALIGIANALLLWEGSM